MLWRPRSGPPTAALVSVEGARTKVHQMGSAQTFLQEVDREALRQRLAIPAIGPEKLLIGIARLVPIGEQRACVIDTLAVPALRDHVQLFADLSLVDLLRVVGIRHVIDTGLAIHEAVDEEG